VDLTTTYLGLRLPHPLIAGAGPVSGSPDKAKRAEDAGAAAIILPSLFEEQIMQEALATAAATETHAESFSEATSYFADPEEFVVGPDTYLNQVSQTKQVVDIPVIASLNGYTLGGWLDYAGAIEQAGADALELNLYYVAADTDETAAFIEHRSIEMVREVRRHIQIPLAVKLSAFYTSLPNFVHRLEAAGADAVVLFNRFFEADLDLEELEIRSELRLSHSNELLLRLRWLAILNPLLKQARLAVTGGVHTGVDAIKAGMCGASAIQMVSALLRNSVGHLNRVLGEMREYMTEKEYESFEQLRGSMDRSRCPNPEALERANYMHQLQTWKGETG